MKAWMGDCQQGVIDDPVGIKQQIEIQRPWSPPLAIDAIATTGAFDSAEQSEQGEWGSAAGDHADCVEVGALPGRSEGGGLDHRRAIEHAQAIGPIQQNERCIKVG